MFMGQLAQTLALLSVSFVIAAAFILAAVSMADPYAQRDLEYATGEKSLGMCENSQPSLKIQLLENSEEFTATVENSHRVNDTCVNIQHVYYGHFVDGEYSSTLVFSSIPSHYKNASA